SRRTTRGAPIFVPRRKGSSSVGSAHVSPAGAMSAHAGGPAHGRDDGPIAVIFEVCLAEGRTGDYLDRAAALVPLLESMDGFLSVERFQSLGDPGKILSLSIWRDEAAVAAWR